MKDTYYDLRGISLDAFLDLNFEHPVANKNINEKEWYWGQDARIDWDKAFVVGLYIELFSRADELMARYSKDKLEQGFWFMMSGSLDFTPYQLIHDEKLNIEEKERLISSMYFLYEKFFFYESLESSSYMWWDTFADEFDIPGQRRPEDYENDKRIQDVMFSTLVKILSLDSELCQAAAIHGLGHLMHPDTERVIKDYMKRHPQLTEKQIDYLNNCITGDIM